MSDTRKSSSVIELSTVYFCEGTVPSTISLKDCGLQLPGIPGKFLAALYGNQSKQEGFMAAREYAERNRLHFTVVDFLVALEHKINPGQMKAEEFGDYDFLAFQRLARSGAEKIRELLDTVELPGSMPSVDREGVKPGALILERPALISVLSEAEALRHFKVIAFQARPVMSERNLTIGAVPFEHWASISEATCRLNPTTRVKLDAPQQSNAAAPLKPQAPRMRKDRPRG